MLSIADLPRIISMLPKSEKELFNRLFSVDSYTGKLKVPDNMKPWAKKQFGSVSAVASQKIIRIENRITRESSVFNELRAKRPIVKTSGDSSSVDEEIKKAGGGPFCNPKKQTPEDVFGRIKGKKSITASNIAKYDKWHGLVIFDNHNPLKFTKEDVEDYLETAQKWITKAHKEDKSANYPLIFWHCLWKSAASIIHGHMQVSLARKSHYAAIDLLNKLRNDYEEKYGNGNKNKSNYFNDLYNVHKSIKLAMEKNSIKIISHLTPKKEKEVLLISQSKNMKKLTAQIYKALACFRDDLGVQSFTMAINMPPVTPEKDWKGFPIMARIIDRGPLSQKTADFAAMEIYAGTSVVAYDPYAVFRNLRKNIM